jgi:uncharacterized YccA/Bax inhibitor family protein
MALFNSSPFMNEDKYQNVLDAPVAMEGKMTVAGAVNKTLILTGLLLATATVGFLIPNVAFIAVGGIVGFIVVLVAGFKPHLSTYLAPTYAIFKGLVVGTVTAYYANAFDGLVFNAIISTIGILAAMLFIYKSRIIVVTEKFRAGVMMAFMGIALVYLVNFVLWLCGIQIPMLHQGGTLGICISVGVIIVATLKLLVDFDTIEKGAEYGSPKYMEWYSAMGLLVTLVWLYFELLRLLAMLARER